MTPSHDNHDHDHAACDSESAGLTTDAARLEALVTDGVHHIGPNEGPFSLHVLGIGKAGTNIAEAIVRAHQENPGEVPLHVLGMDIGGSELEGLQEAGRSGAASVQTVEIPVLSNSEFFAGLRRYREFLKSEFPRYYWNPNYEPWLPNDMAMPEPGDHLDRAVSKGLYGVDYYTGGASAGALDDFAAAIQDSEQTPLVVVAFSIAGGTGSGIVVELARHLSNIRLGRRPLVLGIGVLPCEGDPDELSDGRTFIALNELDCMIDSEKNAGVVTVWGDLYRNPFTAGFFAVPQSGVFARTGDLDETHRIVDAGVADWVVRDGGRHVYESVKALNWLNVPADKWHPATRGDQTDRWINLLSVGAGAGDPLPTSDITRDATVPFAEVRGFGVDSSVLTSVAEQFSDQLDLTLGPNTLSFESDDEPSLVTLIPQLSKLDLAGFAPARSAYDGLTWEEKLVRHAWLLDLGVLLCEPSTRFEGVGGECLLGCACWVVVPFSAIRGEEIEVVAQ